MGGIRGRDLLSSSKVIGGPIRDRDCNSTIPGVKKDCDKYSSKRSPRDNRRWISSLDSYRDSNETHER